MDVAELNRLELEKLHLMSDYVNTMLDLEGRLSEYRLCLSKTKSIVGFSNVSASLVDLRDMEPTVRVAFDDAKNSFVLSGDTDEEPRSGVVKRNKQAEKQEKPKVLKNYKPFGEFEPQSAKQARSIIEKVIQLSGELATVQRNIQRLQPQK